MTSPRPILLIAPNGMLGRAWHELLHGRGLPHRSVGRPELDLADDASINRVIADDIGTVINCAAWTDVDGAEMHEAQATAINGGGVSSLARRCDEVGATLVTYSTDYVFDGEATEPYRIDHPRAPLNAYGRSKAAGEAALENFAPHADAERGSASEASGINPHHTALRWLNLRTSWLYAPWGKNFVLTIAKLAAERDELKVVADQRGRPTSCEHLAAASLAMLDAEGGEGGEGGGHHHLTDGGECTWHEFATAIAAHVNPSCRVLPCTTADFPRPAKRPAYSVLDLSATERLIGPRPPWQDNLATVLSSI